MGNLEFQRKAATRRGWYILESTIALFGVAALILSAADIARIFHARNAVRAGVSDGLRCLYPTAEECTTAAGGGALLQAPLFNASFQAPGGYEFPRTSYSLRASWFNEPMLRVPQNNLALASALVDYKTDPYGDFNVRFPVEAHAAYLVKVRDLPRVALSGEPGLPLNERVLQAVFVNRKTGEKLSGTCPGDLCDYPGDKVIQLSGISETTTATSRTYMGEVSFSLEDAWSTRNQDITALRALRQTYGYQGPVPCYQGDVSQNSDGARIVWPAGVPPEACQYHSNQADLFDGSDVLVPVMLRISGDRYNTTGADVKGAVSAELVYKVGGTEFKYDLTGRQFDRGTTNADFVIRGVGNGFDTSQKYFDTCEQVDYGECEKHESLPLIPRKAQVTVKFYIQRTSTQVGTVGWAGDYLQIFYPKFALAHETVACGSSLTPHQCQTSVEPMRPLFTHTDVAQGIASEPVSGSATQCVRQAPSGSYSSEQEALATLQRKFSSKESPLVATTFTAGLPEGAFSCQSEQQSYPCTDKGVEFLQGCKPTPEFTQEQLLAKCSVPDFTPNRDQIHAGVFKERRLTTFDERLGCTATSYPACAEPYAEKIGEKFLGQGDDIQCLKAIQRTCKAWEVPAYFDVESKEECPNIAEDLISEYRDTCTLLPADARVTLESKPEEPLTAVEPPINECQKFAKRQSVEVACAHGVSYAAAQACCEANPTGCHIERAAPMSGSGSESVWEQRGALAVARAKETIQMAYPRARFNDGGVCESSDKHCVEIQSPGQPDIASRVRMAATMRVPLAMLRWLGLDGLSEVSYSEERVLEESLVR